MATSTKHPSFTLSHNGNSMCGGSVSGSEWEELMSADGGESLRNLDQFSVASLSSDESDAVIIFEGGGLGDPPMTMTTTISNVRNNRNNISAATMQSSLDDDMDQPWQRRHQRLLSAVSIEGSSTGSGVGIGKIPVSGNEGDIATSPMVQRLLDQIAKLTQELNNSQEQAKHLSLQNDNLMGKNDTLIYQLMQRRLKENGERKGEGSQEIMKATVAMMAGIVLLGLVKKKLLFNSVSLVGATVLGSFATWNYWINGDDNTNSARNTNDNTDQVEQQQQ